MPVPTRRTRSLLQQNDFVEKLEEVQRDAKKLNLNDPRFAAAIGVLVSEDLRRACFGDEEDKENWMKRDEEEGEDDECEVKGMILSDPVMAQVSADFEEKVKVA